MAPHDIPKSRAAARRQGARFYMATACPTHPLAARYTANARCVECCKAERRNAAATLAGKANDAARKRAWRAARSSLATTDQFADLLG